jgi:hypothetical protein
MTARCISSGRSCGRCRTCQVLGYSGDFIDHRFGLEHFLHDQCFERRGNLTLTGLIVLVQDRPQKGWF